MDSALKSTYIVDIGVGQGEKSFGTTGVSKVKIIEEEIRRLKKKRNAVILAHNYQPAEVQNEADFCGDSLELSRTAQDSCAEVIVFCGVHFMAETAALLSPEKAVLLPDPNAGCPMADMITPGDVLKMRRERPNALVVCYVNSSAAVKAVSDVCCTSANAVEIVSRIPKDREIIFVPDKYLGSHVEKAAGRKMFLWPGFCPTHARIEAEHVEGARLEHSDAVVVVHPECRDEVREAADEVLSTGGMCRFAKETKAETIVVGTEIGLLNRLKKENPEKKFVALYDYAVCPNMKRTTLQSIETALREMKPRMEIPADIMGGASRAVEKMFD